MAPATGSLTGPRVRCCCLLPYLEYATEGFSLGLATPKREYLLQSVTTSSGYRDDSRSR